MLLRACGDWRFQLLAVRVLPAQPGSHGEFEPSHPINAVLWGVFQKTPSLPSLGCVWDSKHPRQVQLERPMCVSGRLHCGTGAATAASAHGRARKMGKRALSVAWTMDRALEIGMAPTELCQGQPFWSFQKQLQRGRNRLFSSGDRQDIKWALVGESQVKHREKQSKQSSRSSSASVEVPGSRAGVGWDGRAPTSLLDPVPFLLDPVGIPRHWCGHQLCSSPSLGHLLLPPDLLCCANISLPSPLPHLLGGGTGFLSWPGRCRR